MFDDIKEIISQKRDLSALDLNAISYDAQHAQALLYVKHQLKKLAQQTPAFCLFENPKFDHFFPSLCTTVMRQRFQAMLESINSQGVIDSGTRTMCVKNGDYEALIFMQSNGKQSILILMDATNHAVLVDDDMGKTIAEIKE